MSRQIYFHLGLAKVASTFLQRNIFPYFTNFYFIKKHHFKHYRTLIPQSASEKILLSTETNIYRETEINKLRSVAKDFPDVQPIILLRRQGSWIKSKYKYYLRKHGNADLIDYFNPYTQQGLIAADQLQLFPKIQCIEQIYQKRPIVLFHEELENNPSGFVNLIAQSIGAHYHPQKIPLRPVKKSFSEQQLKSIKRFNQVYPFYPDKISYKPLKKLYNKVSAGLLHTVAYTSGLLPDPKKQKNASPLIPGSILRKIDELYAEDWNKCIEYVQQDRELLI